MSILFSKDLAKDSNLYTFDLDFQGYSGSKADFFNSWYCLPDIVTY